jgi:hypothetical protein
MISSIEDVPRGLPFVSRHPLGGPGQAARNLPTVALAAYVLVSGLEFPDEDAGRVGVMCQGEKWENSVSVGAESLVVAEEEPPGHRALRLSKEASVTRIRHPS